MCVGFQLAVPLACFNHGDTDTVFNTIERLEKFALGEYSRLVRWNQSIDPNHWRIADCLCDVLECLASRHLNFPFREHR
jgi:hypothetical protein